MQRTAQYWVIAGLALAAACGGGGGDDGGTGPSPSSTSYSGFMTADDGSSAGLSLTFASAVSIRANRSAPVAVTGVATLVGGGTVSLSGSVDNGDFTATGGGLTLTGTLSDGVLNGRFTATGGVNGGFVAAAATDSHPVYAYCGTYSGTVVGTTDEETGSWHALVTGSDVVGDIIPDGTSADAFLTGFLGSASAGAGGTTTVTVNIDAGDQSLTADGSIPSDWSTLTGQYSKRFPGVAGQSSDGTFSGERCPGT